MNPNRARAQLNLHTCYNPVRFGPFVGLVGGGDTVLNRLWRNFAPDGFWESRQPDLSRTVRKAEPWEILAFGLGGPALVLLDTRPGGAIQLDYRHLKEPVDEIVPEKDLGKLVGGRRALLLVPKTSPWHPLRRGEQTPQAFLAEHPDALRTTFRPLRTEPKEFRVRFGSSTHRIRVTAAGKLALLDTTPDTECKCREVLAGWGRSRRLSKVPTEIRAELTRRGVTRSLLRGDARPSPEAVQPPVCKKPRRNVRGRSRWTRRRSLARRITPQLHRRCGRNR
jgi:hypothetical protein